MVTSSSDPVEELLQRITALEKRADKLERVNEALREDNEALHEENEELREANQELRHENKRLRAKLRWYEGPHTPPSKDQSSAGESSSSDDEDDDDSARTDGGTPGRKPGHDPAFRNAPDPDKEVEVTCDCCPESLVVHSIGHGTSRYGERDQT